MAARETKKNKTAKTNKHKVKEFLEAVNALEKKHELRLTVDDINPHQLIVRKLSGQTIAWLGREEAVFDEAYVDVTELD